MAQRGLLLCTHFLPGKELHINEGMDIVQFFLYSVVLCSLNFQKMCIMGNPNKEIFFDVQLRDVQVWR